MNAYTEKLHHAAEHGCAMCKFEIEELGPSLGPERPPDPGVKRWSMSPEEWAGQEMPDAPEWR